jgi:ABC-type dipeptide/oligopeptide/nickel transport system permease component
MGIPWGQVLRRHVLRPASPTLIAGWLGSLRLMIGSQPLIEFFFAYPGLGMRLVLSLGIGYPDRAGHFQPDLAIGFLVAMAAMVVVIETGGGIAQRLLDPRLNELRSAA